MRDIRVTDDFFTGPVTDDDEDVDLRDDEAWPHDRPDAIDRFLAEGACADRERAAGLPSAA